jgi:type VI secretion system protein ImpM
MGTSAGWYGKLPTLGDFAQRRLPHAFVEGWDGWLQQCLQASRTALGPGWLEHYLSAPAWRFVLLPGVIGAEPWAGVLLPSVDRVGRYFPLTVCSRLPVCAPLGSSLAALECWLEELATCALLGLDAESGYGRLEAALQGLALPAMPPGLPTPQTDQGESATTTGFLDALAARLLPRLLAGESIWWCCSPGASSTGFSCQGLPPATAFAALLCGRAPAGSAQSGPADSSATHGGHPA